jgi:hypothetical protein
LCSSTEDAKEIAKKTLWRQFEEPGTLDQVAKLATELSAQDLRIRWLARAM